MPAVDSSFVILPRFTTLVGATTFTTLPMDVSSYGGAQFQIWRGPIRTKSGTPAPSFTVYLEESLDTEEWVLGPETSQPFVVGQVDRKFFAYDFRLRWFRLKVLLAGDEPIVTCWAEGLLRGGGGGLWPELGINAGPLGGLAPGSRLPTSGARPLGGSFYSDEIRARFPGEPDSVIAQQLAMEQARQRADYMAQVDPNNETGWMNPWP